jgi:hypothetical protein
LQRQRERESEQSRAEEHLVWSSTKEADLLQQQFVGVGGAVVGTTKPQQQQPPSTAEYTNQSVFIGSNQSICLSHTDNAILRLLMKMVMVRRRDSQATRNNGPQL